MSLPQTEPFFISYRRLLDQIIHHGILHENARTGQIVSALPGGCSFKVPTDNLLMPLPGNRRIAPFVAAAEIAWFLQGTRDVTWLQNHVKIWDKFTEEDGVTIKNAYGYRWRRTFGRDQINDAVTALTASPSSRQVLISAWDPTNDGLMAPAQKNIPCPTHFTLNIIDNKLHCCLFIRSSDVFVGLPYDILGQAMLMNMFACTLHVELGSLHVTLANAHIYQPHFYMAIESMKWATASSAPLPSWVLHDVIISPDQFVEEVKFRSKDIEWPGYNPKPEVIV